MNTKDKVFGVAIPYILRNTHTEMPDLTFNKGNARNNQKHIESCLKAKRKRKKKKR